MVYLFSVPFFIIKPTINVIYLLKDEMQVPKQPLPVGQHVSFYFCSSRVTQFADLVRVVAKQSHLEVPQPQHMQFTNAESAV